MGNDIEILIQKISRLPGLGPRSARRIALHLIKNKDKVLAPLTSTMEKAFNNIKSCPICFNIDTFDEICSICSNPGRSQDIICIVESVADLWAIERTYCFKGTYHVIRSPLSSIDDSGPEHLLLDHLEKRCKKNSVTEIIIALNATIEGQTTGQYIKNFFKNSDISITSLAHGIPIGGELDYLDDATLFTAFSARI